MHQQKVATKEMKPEELLDDQIISGKAEVLLCINDTPIVDIYALFVSKLLSQN